MKKISLKTLVSTADQHIDRVEVYSVNAEGTKFYEYGFQLIGDKSNEEKAQFIDSKLKYDSWSLFENEEITVLEVFYKQ